MKMTKLWQSLSLKQYTGSLRYSKKKKAESTALLTGWNTVVLLSDKHMHVYGNAPKDTESATPLL